MTRAFVSIGAALLWLQGATAISQAAPQPPAGTPRTITLADYEAIKFPGSLALSRDGRLLAYVLDDQIYVVPMAGGAPRAVTAAGSSAWDPYWSKDGSALYFLSDRSDGNQLWKLALNTFGEATQVTNFKHGIDELDFSPDESRLLLRFKASDLAESAAAEEKKPFVITRLHFKEDAGEGYLTGDQAEHLYILERASGKLVQVTSGDYSESDPAWSPDGGQIVFVSNREAEPDASYKTDLWLVASGNTDQGKSLVRLTNDDRIKSDPAWSPDGRTIAFLSAEDGDYGILQLAVIPESGGVARNLTAELDRWVDDFRFSTDGQWIHFNYQHEGGARLARVRPKDGKLESITSGDQFIGAFDVAANGAVAARIESGNRGPELYSVANGRLGRLTQINDAFLDSVALGTKDSVSFKSTDGTIVQAFITKPPGFVAGRKYPTILRIHGGPVMQSEWGFDFEPQYLAANGYVVIDPNPRGSSGRGQEFARATYQSWGITDYDDVIAAVEHAIEAGYADPDRLGVTGYSYGGYMTNVVITRTDRFKAAASGAGSSYAAANYGHDIYQKSYNWELGPPWENREKYDRLSPLLQAGKVTTPTLFLGGRDDWNMPILNAELFYQSLRMRGIDTQLVVYPDTHHEDWSPEFDRDYYNRVREWFDKYLK